MFATRHQFWRQKAAPVGGFGNNALFDGSTDQFLSVPSVTDLITWRATSGFTIEYWFYATVEPGTINGGPGNHNAVSTNYWSFGPTTNRRIEFYFWTPGQTFIRTDDNAYSLNTWHNVAMVSTTSGTNTTTSIYLDGVRQQVRLDSGSLGNSVTQSGGVVATGTPFRMGRYGSGANPNRWDTFFMDNLRVSNIDRYSGASYTVQTEPFTDDANTQLLMICDEPNNTTTFTDSSSANRTVTNNNDRVVATDQRANHS